MLVTATTSKLSAQSRDTAPKKREYEIRRVKKQPQKRKNRNQYVKISDEMAKIKLGGIK